ncbi:hypothetical protein PI124_g15506 [Phytophthora idaei]|nr:hypothetical protein PI124_g15506 [Phytophthora idaei]
MAEMFPVTGHYLRPDAEIVHSPVFESAVVKVSRVMKPHRASLLPMNFEMIVFLRTNLSMMRLKDNTIEQIIHFFIVMSEH